MSHTSFCGRHPLIALLAFTLLICGSAAIARTQIQLGMDQQVHMSPSNPHGIPDHMDPKSQALADEVRAIKVEIREEMIEASETVHAIAFQDRHGSSQQTLDYTTGTSN